MNRRQLVPFALGAVSSLVLSSAMADTPFELGTVVVTGEHATPAAAGESVIEQKTLTQFNRDTVGEAVSLIPGMSVSRNSRNEDIVYLRGFDVRQVPLFVDGIPLYVPYDGYVDFSRFTTYDLSELRVAKGAASLIYGPNTLGGAINLVTRKPSRPLEGDVRVGYASGNERKVAANLGTNQGKWYAQLSASYLKADDFPLSDDFSPKSIRTSRTNATPLVVEDGGHRENSYRQDSKLSFKFGLTPNATDEYAVGYVRQEGEKGNPPYAGAAPGTLGSSIRYWRWPYWDIYSTYFLSKTALGDNHVLKVRVYDDQYKNSILAYTDGKYGTQINNTSFPSWYNDFTRGASVELVSYALPAQELRVAYHYKEDKHTESNPNVVDKRFRDITTSLAVEDAITLAPTWRLRLGASRDERDGKEAYTYTKGDTAKTNWLAALSHNLGENAEVYASLARKSRFPTIKDRYSFRLGSALYNPDLRPETADNAELGIQGSPWAGARGQANVFYSRIRDLMQSVVVAAPGICPTGPTPNVTCNQLQNIARSRHAGYELSLEQKFGGQWTAGANFTYLVRTNQSNDAIPLTDTPRTKLFAHLGWTPSDVWELQGTVDAERRRVVPYGSEYTRLGGFVLLGAKAIWKPRKDTSVELGVANLTDENYELADGYPMPGRTWFANATYSF
jgi:iron complex outermembrane recepter protein